MNAGDGTLDHVLDKARRVFDFHIGDCGQKDDGSQPLRCVLPLETTLADFGDV